MHIVSAAKLAKLKEIAGRLDKFSGLLGQIIDDVTSTEVFSLLERGESKIFAQKAVAKHLLLVITSDKGLCGGFNSNLLKQVRKQIAEYQAKNIEFGLIVVGRKGLDNLKADFAGNIINSYNWPKGDIEQLAAKLKLLIVKLFEEENFSHCLLCYNKFINALRCEQRLEGILPVAHDDSKVSQISAYEYEGDELFLDLINLYIHGQAKTPYCIAEPAKKGRE